MKTILDNLNAQKWVRYEDFYAVRLDACGVSLQGAYVSQNIRHYKTILDAEFKIDSSGFTQCEKVIDGVNYRLIFT